MGDHFKDNPALGRATKGIKMEKVELGDLVKDEVTGFKGIAIGITRWLNGCERVTIQPPVEKDGKYPDAMTVDAPQISITKKAKFKTPFKIEETKENRPGGPSIKVSAPKARY